MIEPKYRFPLRAQGDRQFSTVIRQQPPVCLTYLRTMGLGWSAFGPPVLLGFGNRLLFVIRCRCAIRHVLSETLRFTRRTESDRSFFLVRIVWFVVVVIWFRFDFLTDILVSNPVHITVFQTTWLSVINQSKIFSEFNRMLHKAAKSFLEFMIGKCKILFKSFV